MFAAKSKSNTAGNATLRNQPKSSISSGAMMNNSKVAGGAPRNATSTAGVKPLQQQARAKYAENRGATQSKAAGGSSATTLTNKPIQPLRTTKPSNEKSAAAANKTPTNMPAKSTRIFKPYATTTTTRPAAPRNTAAFAASSQVKSKIGDTQQTATARLASTYKSKTTAAAAGAAGATAATVPKRIWNRYQTRVPAATTLNQAKDSLRECAGDNNANDKACSTVTKALNEMAIQSNEAEILNHDLLMGDIKFLLPSQELVHVIEEERKERHTKEMLKAERKYEPHSMQESQHLSDLKEFLERSAITKKPRTRRTIESLESDRKVIAAMDEMIARALPKTESITNIKERIKRKEHELMSLFETVDRLKRV